MRELLEHPVELELEYAGRLIGVRGLSAATAEWLGEFFSPAFRVVNLGPCPTADFTEGPRTYDWSIKVEPFAGPTPRSRGQKHAPAQERAPADDANASEFCGPGWEVDAFTLDGEFESAECLLNTPDTSVVRTRRHGLLLEIQRTTALIRVLKTPSVTALRLGLMRIIRELATIQALNQQFLPIHGAVIADQAGAYLFTGQKRAGKTTTALRHLLTVPSEFLANDRAFVSVQREGCLVRGMPTILKIRPDSLRLLPTLHQEYRQRPYHRDETLAEAQTRFLQPDHPRNQTLELTPSISLAQLAALTGAPLAQQRPLRAILFPRVDLERARSELLPLAAELAGHTLWSQGLLRPSQPLRTSSLWSRHGDVRSHSEDLLLGRCLQLAQRVPCYQYLIGQQDNLSDLLDRSPRVGRRIA